MPHTLTWPSFEEYRRAVLARAVSPSDLLLQSGVEPSLTPPRRASGRAVLADGRTLHALARVQTSRLIAIEGLIDALGSILIRDGSGTHVVTPGMQGIPSGSPLRLLGSSGDDVFIWADSFTHSGTLATWDRGGRCLRLLAQPESAVAAMATHRRVVAVSPDGTRVSVDCYGHPRSPRPTILHVYGGFGIPTQAGFSPTISASWISRGATFAVAHVRGGGEYGESWHRQGTRQGRRLVREDVVAAATALVSLGVVTKDTLLLHGMSHGALVAATAGIRHPQVFRNVVCQAPLARTDDLCTMRAPHEWLDEYGDPRTADWDDYMRDEDPLACAPASDAPLEGTRWLITSGGQDTVTPPSHADDLALRVSALGARTTSMRSSDPRCTHEGASSPMLRLHDAYRLWSWIAECVGLKGKQSQDAGPRAVPAVGGARC